MVVGGREIPKVITDTTSSTLSTTSSVFKMAPCFNLIHKKWMSSFHSRFDDELGFGEDDDGLVEIVNKKLDVIDWVKARKEVPTINSTPTIGKERQHPSLNL